MDDTARHDDSAICTQRGYIAQRHWGRQSCACVGLVKPHNTLTQNVG
jgi:hypothetical protein